MTVMTTVVGQHVYDISWEHPWKEVDFRGENRFIKVTNCAIGLNLGTDPETDKVKYRWLGHGCAKWPIEATDPNSDSPGSTSRLLLKGEKLNRDRARRIALTRAIGPDGAKLDKATRTAIWENYFRTFNSAQRPTPTTPTTPPMTPTPAYVMAPSPYIPDVQSRFETHRVVNKVVTHLRFMAPASPYLH